MKTIYIFIFSTLCLISCNSKQSTVEKSEETTIPNQQTTSKENPASSDPNKYKEYHDNGTLSIEGQFDENKLRHGLWTSYYENGIKWSEMYYIHGKKHGHSLAFYPNGKPRYIGEYQNDKKYGEWTFYNDKGEKINENK